MDLNFQFTSLSELVWMKGHGPYVWAAYAITFAGIIFLAVTPRFALKEFVKTQRALFRRAREDAAE